MTKTIRVAVSVILLSVAAFAQSDMQKAFQTIKTLSGGWEGTASDGKPVRVQFKDTAGGSAVMSEILGHEEMITMFHMDGADRLMLTHYCAAGNQPRMQASISADGKVFTFTFLDATGLATADAGHMQRVVFTLIDANHHTEDWTFVNHGKEMKEVFDLRRKG